MGIAHSLTLRGGCMVWEHHCAHVRLFRYFAYQGRASWATIESTVWNCWINAAKMINMRTMLAAWFRSAVLKPAEDAYLMSQLHLSAAAGGYNEHKWNSHEICDVNTDWNWYVNWHGYKYTVMQRLLRWQFWQIQLFASVWFSSCKRQKKTSFESFSPRPHPFVVMFLKCSCPDGVLLLN